MRVIFAPSLKFSSEIGQIVSIFLNSRELYTKFSVEFAISCSVGARFSSEYVDASSPKEPNAFCMIVRKMFGVFRYKRGTDPVAPVAPEPTPAPAPAPKTETLGLRLLYTCSIGGVRGTDKGVCGDLGDADDVIEPGMRRGEPAEFVLEFMPLPVADADVPTETGGDWCL